MNNVLPFAFGFCSLFIGVNLLLLSFGFYKKKDRTQEQIDKNDAFYSKYGLIIKIFGLILIFRGGYNILNPDPNRYVLESEKVVSNRNKTEHNNDVWETKDREILVEKCIKETGLNGKRHPDVIRDYCECSIDNIMIAMTKEEYLENLEKPIEEQTKTQLPLFQSCYDIMSKKIDSLDYHSSN